MTSWKILSLLSTPVLRLALCLDSRIRPLFQAILIDIFCTAERRRTASSWFRAGGIGDEFRRAYHAIGSVARQAEHMATTLLLEVKHAPVLADQEEMTFALDDTPSKRYGPEVEGAGLHHNPTPGPSGAAFVYGHSFVALARVASHPEHGTICLPVRADLYVRAKDLPKVPPEREWKFRTKTELAVAQLKWLDRWARGTHAALGVVFDGGYAKRPVLQAPQKLGIHVVSRLRKDAALRTLPGPQPPGKRGRKPIYGRQVIRLAKRAAHPAGWQTATMQLYGQWQEKTYKTFLATWAPAGGVIRVVLVKEEHGWRAYFSTNPDATPAQILGKVAQRTSIEEMFKDVKQVEGAGQQQLRNIHANIGAWHLNLWAYTMTELWAWSKPAEELVDRSASPWDSEPRRPSHADRRKALQRQALQEEFQAALEEPDQNEKLKRLCLRLMQIAV